MRTYSLWLLLGALVAGATAPGLAQRQVLPLNADWRFHFGADTRKAPTTDTVDLPHTWNADEVYTATFDYYRGTGVYQRTLAAPAAWAGKRLFLRFEGVSSTAQVLVNQRWAGEHAGGYTAFCIEITDLVRAGEDNLLTVMASNAYRADVLPLVGDFNVYGGIHRPVSLIVTEPDCVSPLDYASPGVYLTTTSLTAQLAEVVVRTKLSLTDTVGAVPLSVLTTVFDADGREVATQTTAAPAGATEVQQALTIREPHRWHGTADPYLYRARVQLRRGGTVVDEVSQPLGLRTFRVDADRGFFLNDEYLDLRGFCRHEDVAGRASALAPADHARDLALALEAGATALRLTHYPQSQAFIDGCNSAGLVVWSEIPLVGPGGYPGAGYLAHPGLEAHGRQVLTEMIRQQYNHPAVAFWGLFNELKLDYDRPDAYVRSLDSLAQREDSTRLTVLATFQADTVFTDLSDVLGWNKYFGWYGGRPSQLGDWADRVHALLPTRPVSVSEYGAGGSARQHANDTLPADPNSRWHPEGAQARYHEGSWAELQSRPFLWGKYIWVLADFGSGVRAEGDTVGINDKGLVSYDRSVKKDAFYFYKANWNPAPMLYLADRRYVERTEATTTVKVYSNLPNVTLSVNGRTIGSRAPDATHVARWREVRLRPGENVVEISGESGGEVLRDRCNWELRP